MDSVWLEGGGTVVDDVGDVYLTHISLLIVQLV